MTTDSTRDCMLQHIRVLTRQDEKASGSTSKTRTASAVAATADLTTAIKSLIAWCFAYRFHQQKLEDLE